MAEEYLGIVQVPPTLGSSIEFSRLRPTHVARNGSWQPIEDAVAAFPDKGLVFWYKPNRPIKVGSLWAFGVATQPHYDASRGHDRMQVAASERTRTPLEAITLTYADDLREFRRALTSMSVKLPLRPIGRVLLRVPGAAQQWIGPIDPPASGGSGDPSQLLVVSLDGFLKLHDIPDDAFQDIQVDGRTHRLLRPTFELSSHPGYFSLQNDADLLRALLKRAKKWNPELANIVEPAQQLIRAYEQGLASEPLSDDERLRESARLRAARSLMDDLEARLHLDSELMELVVLDLLALPLVNAQLAAKQQEELERKREELRTEMHQELHAARQELADTRAATQRARKELDAVASTMDETVQAIIANAVPKLTEHALFRSLYVERHREPAQISTGDSDVRTLSSHAEIVRATMSAAVASHVDPFVLRLLTSLLAGSGLVLLGGTSAGRTALAAARLLASGSAVRVSVTPAIFGMTDLLNAACSPVGKGDRPATTLGEFLQCAMHEDDVSLVILQGCNRAPAENGLFELMEITAAPRGVHRLAWTNRRGEIQETSVDGRILFVGALASGETTFTIPPALAHRVPAVWTERNVTPREVLANAAAWTPTRATFEAWDIVGESLPPIDEGAIRSFMEIFPSTEAEAIVTAFVRSVRALFSSDAAGGLAEALASLVAGRAQQDHLTQFAKKLPADIRNAFDAAIKSSNEHLSRYYAEEQDG